jgi:hypothetical protein
MNEDTIVLWLLQPQAICIAIAGGFVPGLIAVFKRRAVTLWYLYGFACTLVALLAVPTIHARLAVAHPLADLPHHFTLHLLKDGSVQRYCEVVWMDRRFVGVKFVEFAT